MSTDRHVSTVSAAEARRLLLHSQGLTGDPARRATPAAVHALIERMGFVQVDTMSAVARAHHHILATRFDGYRPRMLTKLLERDRKLFEHWTHDAAVLPAAWFAQWKPYFVRCDEALRAHKWWFRFMPDPDRVLNAVRRRIQREGPLMSKDFESGRLRKSQGWWDWTPEKRALEHLWRCGELAIAKRVNFHKVYDLMERVHPDLVTLPAPEHAAYVDWRCRSAMERLGVATPVELRQFWGGLSADDAKAWCAGAVEAGQVVDVLVESEDGSKPRKAFAFADVHRRAAKVPAPPDRMRLLSPFDPLIHDRKRTQRLFNFDYRLEAFTPAKKRTYGYFVLPMLEGDCFVGRADAKLHRDRSELKVNRVWWEAGVTPTKTRRRTLEAATACLAAQLEADRWTLPRA